MREILIDLAVYEGFPADWADTKFDDWYTSDEEIGFIEYLYQLEATRGTVDVCA